MTPSQIWAALISLLVLVLSSSVVQGCNDRLAYERRLEQWHRRCDAYVGKPTTGPLLDGCRRDLDELRAYAKGKGWTPSR